MLKALTYEILLTHNPNTLNSTIQYTKVFTSCHAGCCLSCEITLTLDKYFAEKIVWLYICLNPPVSNVLFLYLSRARCSSLNFSVINCGMSRRVGQEMLASLRGNAEAKQQTKPAYLPSSPAYLFLDIFTLKGTCKYFCRDAAQKKSS